MFANGTSNLGLLKSFHCVKSGEVVTDSRIPVRNFARFYGLQTVFVARSIFLKGVEAVNDKESHGLTAINGK